MTTQVIRGSKAQIAERVTKSPGRILEAVLFFDEADVAPAPLNDQQFEQLMSEMAADAVSVGGADFSRESIY